MFMLSSFLSLALFINVLEAQSLFLECKVWVNLSHQFLLLFCTSKSSLRCNSHINKSCQLSAIPGILLTEGKKKTLVFSNSILSVWTLSLFLTATCNTVNINVSGIQCHTHNQSRNILLPQCLGPITTALQLTQFC